MEDRWEKEENRGQEGQHHRDEEKKNERGQKEEDGRGEGREGRVGVLIETRTKASGGRAETAGETEKREDRGS